MGRVYESPIPAFKQDYWPLMVIINSRVNMIPEGGYPLMWLQTATLLGSGRRRMKTPSGLMVWVDNNIT